MTWPHVKEGLAFEWRRIRRKSPFHLIRAACSHILGWLLWLTLLPLTALLHLAGYRCLTVFTDRVGHLALEPDCLLKEQALGAIPRRRWLMICPPARCANKHLLNYWKGLIRVYEHPIVCFFIKSMSRLVLMREDVSGYARAAGQGQSAYRIYRRWGHRPPILTMSEADEQWGAAKLRELGIPDQAWFVCVHVREPGFSPVDEELHSHRNGSIEAVTPAIEEITARGGWVVRLGDRTMSRLPAMPKVIDYAHHPLKSERLDIVLCAKCRFHLGNSSGISLVGTVFGVPCALANMIPFSALALGPRDLSVQKLLFSERLGRYLTCDEILSSPSSLFMYARLYRDNGIRVVENSPSDVRSLAVEMMTYLDADATPTNDYERAHGSDAIAIRLGPQHYAYGAISKVSCAFIDAHPELGLAQPLGEAQ